MTPNCSAHKQKSWAVSRLGAGGRPRGSGREARGTRKGDSGPPPRCRPGERGEGPGLQIAARRTDIPIPKPGRARRESSGEGFGNSPAGTPPAPDRVVRQGATPCSPCVGSRCGREWIPDSAGRPRNDIKGGHASLPLAGRDEGWGSQGRSSRSVEDRTGSSASLSHTGEWGCVWLGQALTQSHPGIRPRARDPIAVR